MNVFLLLLLSLQKCHDFSSVGGELGGMGGGKIKKKERVIDC